MRIDCQPEHNDCHPEHNDCHPERNDCHPERSEGGQLQHAPFPLTALGVRVTPGGAPKRIAG